MGKGSQETEGNSRNREKKKATEGEQYVGTWWREIAYRKEQ